MKRLSKWAAVALIVIGAGGLIVNFSELGAKVAGPEADPTAPIAPEHIQTAGTAPSAQAIEAAPEKDGKWQKVEKRWEFDSGAFKNLSLSTDYNLHIQVKTDASTDYLELRGVVSPEAAERAFRTGGEADGISLDLTGKPKIQFLSFGSNDADVYLTLGLRDATQLENVSFASSSGTGDFGELTAEKLSIQLSSGDLNARRLSAKHTDLTMTSGSIDVKELDGASRIELSSGNLQIGAMNGDSVIRATSGTIDLTQKNSANLDVEVSSGDISIKPAADFAGVYDVRATSGSIDAPDSPGRNGDTIKVRATSGDISIKP
ncbi:DUF4097 family beta strand repeat-containing protein [Saccharibacillus alkalitolerans]|uniref:DUF4097 domain-containing protein n=1 Tax=Saccharibacillus alkalitolerans TaxID=2705290 RepID=A0ABX0F3H2_9BACL|nr:DUF4097 family beta strand repeat-containing protein [Saccharibacillus alkalitolerans]NGZ75532.1 DUF4097 domain-containing protein [Saccharibacillus alkalitolerans]